MLSLELAKLKLVSAGLHWSTDSKGCKLTFCPLHYQTLHRPVSTHSCVVQISAVRALTGSDSQVGKFVAKESKVKRLHGRRRLKKEEEGRPRVGKMIYGRTIGVNTGRRCYCLGAQLQLRKAFNLNI